VITHVIRPGECMATVAARYGFADENAIYGHPDNAELAKLRPNPNMLYPGDVVYVPEREDRSESIATGGAHTFVVRVAEKQLKIAVHDEDGPRAGVAYTLVVAGETIRGTTDGDGKLDQTIPAHARVGRLTIGAAQYEVEIGALDPIEDTPDDGESGVRGRLRNLGIELPRDDARSLGHAIAMFQVMYDLPVTGIVDAKTIAALQNAHGS